ncbi:VOC family protein [Dactylosporangium salmoneum]|uniref:VOC family protein n=1 Tax=Dactylosporangium salmoneum TaxID=53361 RepID=UPI0031E0459F
MRVRGYAPATPCWSVLSSGDPAAAEAFYCDVFGWTSTRTEDGATVFLLRDQVVAGLADSGGNRTAWLTYIATEDADATAALVAEHGGTVLQPSADILPRGRAALLADPAGGVFGVWQRVRFAGAQVANEPGAICWSETVTWDVAATAAFYGKIFGWIEQDGTADVDAHYHEWIASNRVVGGISPMGEQYPPGTPQHWRTIFSIEDCAAFIARTRELGGQVLAGPVDAGIGHAAHVIDPTGGAFLVIELLPELRHLLG